MSQWAEAALEQVEHGRASALAILLFGLGNGVLGRAVGQAHAEGLDGAGHGVGRVHAAAGAGAGNGAGFDALQLRVVNRFAGVRADRLENRDDVQFARVAGQTAGQNGAAIDKEGRAVEAGHGHDGAGHVFVASADGDKTVHALAGDDRFDGIGDDFAGNQGILHAFRTHRNAVGDGDGVEDDGLAAGAIGAGFGFAGQLVNVGVAGGDHAPGGGDADEGLLEILGREADGVEHGAGGRAFGSVQNEAGVGSEIGAAGSG